jgi:BirA family biotin operon repressor/biotin-[acetyl-CoA-carboxylase] ligase
MSTHMTNFAVHHVQSVDSTNTFLLQRAARQVCHRVVIVAKEQTAGRGQRGRRWHARTGEALLFSASWQFDRNRPIDGLSLAVGVMVAGALDGLSGGRCPGLGLKWPNDLVIDESHKLGGILIETVASSNGTRTAVIGIGLNLQTPSFDDIADGLPPVGLYPLVQRTCEEDELLARILAALDNGLTLFAQHGFNWFAGVWWERSVFRRKRVTIRLPGGELITGQMRSITDRGALVIESERGLHTLFSGEVSLRVAHT